MTALTAAALLATWEEGASQLPVQRALTLLGAAWPDPAGGDWSQVSVGARDGALLRLREALFGTRLDATAICPSCGERLDLTFTTRDILVAPAAGPAAALALDESGYAIHYRLATSADLLAVAALPAPEAREALLRRCILTARRGEEEVEPARLPERVEAALLSEMASVDAQADVQVPLVCPACAHRWSMGFDILPYLWSEIDDWAHRLLQEVHALARSYGWREQDILAMTARRRRLYLELVGI